MTPQTLLLQNLCPPWSCTFPWSLGVTDLTGFYYIYAFISRSGYISHGVGTQTPHKPSIHLNCSQVCPQMPTYSFKYVHRCLLTLSLWLESNISDSSNSSLVSGITMGAKCALLSCSGITMGAECALLSCDFVDITSVSVVTVKSGDLNLVYKI